MVVCAELVVIDGVTIALCNAQNRTRDTRIRQATREPARAVRGALRGMDDSLTVWLPPLVDWKRGKRPGGSTTLYRAQPCTGDGGRVPRARLRAG